MGIGTVLESLFSQLDALGRDISARRRPGLEAQALQARLEALGLSCPDDLAALYAFSDGVNDEPGEAIGKITLFPGYYWVALAEALEIYGAVSTDARWSFSWLPIFASGGGDFYAVICDSKSPDFGAVVGFILGEAEQFVEFESLKAMLETIDRSFLDHAFYMADGRLKADYPRMRAIGRSVQPAFIEHPA